MIGLALAAVLISSAPPSGAIDPNCTVEKICQPGYTATVRPPASYTTKLKIRQMAERGLAGRPHDYEEDHWISLELCGDPLSDKNLWPEPWAEAHQKDRVENYLHRMVCRGEILLEEAQQDIGHWGDFYGEAGERR